MSQESLVSVIICIYQGERFLLQTIEAVLAQTHQRWEIIAVDDGSTDASAEIVRQFRDSRIRMISQNNAGAASALAAGIAIAKGEYLALLDQDDLWDEESLALHVRCLDVHAEIDLTFSWFRVIDDRGHKLSLHSPRYRGTADFETLFQDFVIAATSNVVVRRAAMLHAGTPDPSFPSLYDLDLCLRIALLRPGNVMAIPQELMFYRRHGNQISHNLSVLRKEWARLVAKFEQLRPLSAEVKRHAESNMHRYFARIAYEDGQYGVSMRLLGQGFRFAPLFFLADRRNWVTITAALAGMILPASIHRRLQQLAGLRVGADSSTSADSRKARK
jgi:glycosyltransferase involved in cell wall biosynthesis